MPKRLGELLVSYRLFPETSTQTDPTVHRQNGVTVPLARRLDSRIDTGHRKKQNTNFTAHNRLIADPGILGRAVLLAAVAEDRAISVERPAVAKNMTCRFIILLLLFGIINGV